MNVDEQPPQFSSSSQSSNAIAGPSKAYVPPFLYLPPPGPPRRPPRLANTQELLTRFQLLPAYDKYVRPFIDLNATGQPPSSLDKGKGKEKEAATPAAASTPDGAQDGEDEDGDKKKKGKNYKYLIKGIPGKHSMKKDDYLTTMMQVPPKQRMAIMPFDAKTQRDAFTVSLEGLKGWNINSLVEESPQAREDRKKRKELKKLAKAQSMNAPTPSGSQPIAAPHVLGPPPPASIVPVNVARRPTPKPNLPNPGSGPPSVKVQRATPAATPRPTTVPTASQSRPSSRPPATSTVRATPAPKPAPAPSINQGATPDPFVIKRGKKREREREDPSSSHRNTQGGAAAPQNGVGNGNGQATAKPAGGTKAGVAGARPRPVKKQRVDAQGQAREIPVQQPTPQGV